MFISYGPPYKEWSDIYKACNANIVLMINGSSTKTFWIGIANVKIFYVVKTLTNLKQVLKLRRILISLKTLSIGFWVKRA